MIHRSMTTADAVLAALEAIHDYDNTDLVLETFQNCRENGYHIRGRAGRASFAVHRNGCGIIVYYGPPNGFDLNNFPNDWDRSKGFNLDQFSEAAKFILSVIEVPQEDER